MSFVTYSKEPNFPPEDQFGVGTVREKVGDLWIDWTGQRPSSDEIASRFAPLPEPRDIAAEFDALKSALVKKDSTLAEAVAVEADA